MTTVTATDISRIRACVKGFEFRRLFVEELGWDRLPGAAVQVIVDGVTYALTPLAEKRGMAVYVCEPGVDGEMPEYQTRRRIEAEVAKAKAEHILVFVDRAKTQQRWQWVKREPGKSKAFREHPFYAGSSGERLVQRLARLVFGLEEEDDLTVVQVAERARQALDVERVTKRFYDRFKTEHDKFMATIEGIAEDELRRWYASLMLNRLMFTYFIQKKGFLDGDLNYLSNRLKRVQGLRGRGHFQSFYRSFLRRLFHDGLGHAEPRELDAGLATLIGRVPYLNGGLFEVHQIERSHPQLDIPDEAFERIFTFFDEYEWHLDDRPLRKDNEINPDVLGYIFEKYINQKQMGAYYTKEDITGYISRNTILPYLFDAARKECAIAFAADGEVWRLLRDEPDRYIYAAVRKGVDLDLPAEIAAGLGDVMQRGGWNRPAGPEYALPTETWREHVARRTRCLELRAKLAAGEVHEVNDLITYNLDIERFAQDVIERCEGPELLRAFWKAMTNVTVLDPTCGSGAFLFAALNILEPLYAACLERMQAFVAEWSAKGETRKGEDFRETLRQIEKHPNRRYYILKSIIVGNLYGVDIMEEACEIAKLRLFLKLVSQVEHPEQLEPLPDIDFNIKAGNTLVGFATLEGVRQAMQYGPNGQMRMLAAEDEAALARINEQAEIADRAYQQYRAQQTTHGGKVTAGDKAALNSRLDALRAELDRYLAREYGVDGNDLFAYGPWRDSHKPFHWFVEFYGIVQLRGGFDVIIGNPPWREYSAVRGQYTLNGYSTERCGNLYGMCAERGLALCVKPSKNSVAGYLSFIVQLPFASSARMVAVRKLLRERSEAVWTSPFDDRPGKLFEGLQNCRSVVFVARVAAGTGNADSVAAGYQRWPTQARDVLLPSLQYVPVCATTLYPDQFPKVQNAVHGRVAGRISSKSETVLGTSLTQRPTASFVFYQEATRYWVKATVGLPFYEKNGQQAAPDHGRYMYFRSDGAAFAASALLNSSLFYTYFVTYGDCFHLSDTLAGGFPLAPGVLGDGRLVALGQRLNEELERTAEIKTIRTKDGDQITYAEFYGSKVKPIIDEIDRVLGEHYGFTDEELDFIINYDIKYRMGQDAEET